MAGVVSPLEVAGTEPDEGLRRGAQRLFDGRQANALVGAGDEDALCSVVGHVLSGGPGGVTGCGRWSVDGSATQANRETRSGWVLGGKQRLFKRLDTLLGCDL